MREGREVVLKTDLEIKKEAKRKAKIAVIVIDVVFTIFCLILTSEKREDLSIVPIVILLILWSVVIIVNLLVKYVISLAFEQTEYAKRSIAYVNANLSAESFVKVKNNRQGDFIRKLQDMAEFYAIINEEDNLVEIWIKFNFEREACKYEYVRKEYFYDYYSIQE